VDRPDQCDFTLPAIIDRDPVLVAIGTGGASAGLAKALRQRDRRDAARHARALAEALGRRTDAMRARWPDPASRRRAIDAALSEGGVLDPLSGADEQAVRHWLDDVGEDAATPRLEEVVLHSDDPDDLTLRTARLLGQADAVFHAADIGPLILNRARADAARILAPARPEWTGPGLALWLTRKDQA
jgi:uroporphyrin-III C-methyltransferase/precorrin-2 dehydrogenase/sirohydrochlorin ferrochelatase